MAKEYYCLVAGLKEYALDSENKGFDAVAIRDAICEELSGADLDCVRQLYMFYDVENIINLKAARDKFNILGNFSQEQLREEVSMPQELPVYIKKVLAAYATPDDTEFEDVDTTMAFERSMFTAYYKACAGSTCSFMREWSEFDMNLRNVCAAYTARKGELPVSKVVVGDNFVSSALKRSSAADFGLKGELDYIDDVMTAVTADQNLVQKEKLLDELRWAHADEMTEFDYFNINRILNYLIKINIIERWAQLNPTTGREMFDRLIKSLSSKELIDKAEKEK